MTAASCIAALYHNHKISSSYFDAGPYLLVNDLDASDTANWNNGAGFAPITYFNGTFDGGCHVIRDLTIYRPDSGDIGLFAITAGNSHFSNLGLEGVQIDGFCEVGGLVAYNLGTISRCYVTGTVTAHAGNVNTIPYDYGDVGGLAGTTFGSISECYSTATVRSVSSDGSYGGYWGAFAGGLVGVAYSLYNDVSITNCYATGSVGGLTYVGGLIGMIVGDDNWYGEIVGPYTITIANCYASGNVVGYSGGCGGFTGRVMGAANIENCFSLGNVNGSQGWFSNLNDAVALAGYANDYFLARTGQPDPVISGVSSATAVQLGNVNFAVYHGSTPWNFTSVWAMHNGLPELRLWTAA